MLALESFQVSAQKHLDAYLDGSLTLDGLRQKSKWDRTWGFSWDHYRPLLELAKVRGFKLAAARKMLRENKRGVDDNARIIESLIKVRDELKQLKRQLDYLE